MKDDRSPNWNKWLHIPEVMLWQAASLSLNIDPDKANYSYSWKAEEMLNGESQEFKDRLEILRANLGRNQLKAAAVSLYDPAESKVALRTFAVWAHSIPWTIPNQLIALADEERNVNEFSVWKMRQLWTLSEAAYLLSGELPPRAPVMLMNLIQPRTPDDPIGAPAIIYRDLKDAVDLQQIEFFESRTGDLASRRVKPADCVTWADKYGYTVPEVLADLVPAQTAVASSTDLLVEQQTATSRLNDRERRAYLNTIGALLRLLFGKTQLGKNNSVFKNQASVIDALLENNPNTYGISKRSLEEKFAEANRLIDEE